MITITSRLAIARHVISLTLQSHPSLLALTPTSFPGPLPLQHLTSISTRSFSSSYLSASSTAFSKQDVPSLSTLSPRIRHSSNSALVNGRVQRRSHTTSSTFTPFDEREDKLAQVHRLSEMAHQSLQEKVEQRVIHNPDRPDVLGEEIRQDDDVSLTSIVEQSKIILREPKPANKQSRDRKGGGSGSGKAWPPSHRTSQTHPSQEMIHPMRELFHMSPQAALNRIRSNPKVLYHPSTYSRLPSKISSSIADHDASSLDEPFHLPVPSAANVEFDPNSTLAPQRTRLLIHNRHKRLFTLTSLLFHLSRLPLSRLNRKDKEVVLAIWNQWVGLVESLKEMDSVPYFPRKGCEWVERTIRALIGWRTKPNRVGGKENEGNIPSVDRVLRALEWMSIKPSYAHMMIAIQRLSATDIFTQHHFHNHSSPARPLLSVPGLSEDQPNPEFQLAHFEPHLSEAITTRLVSFLSPLSSPHSNYRLNNSSFRPISSRPGAQRRFEVEKDYFDLSIGHVVLTELEKYERRFGHKAWNENIDTKSIEEWMERRDELMPLWFKLAGQVVERIDNLRFGVTNVGEGESEEGGEVVENKKGRIGNEEWEVAVPTRMESQALWLLLRDRILHRDLASKASIDWRLKAFNLANPFDILRLALGYCSPVKSSLSSPCLLSTLSIPPSRPNRVDTRIIAMVIRLISVYNSMGSLANLGELINLLRANTDMPYDPSTPSPCHGQPKILMPIPAPKLPARTHKRLVLTATSSQVLRRLIEPLSNLSPPDSNTTTDSDLTDDVTGLKSGFAFSLDDEVRLIKVAEDAGLVDELMAILKKWNFKLRYEAQGRIS